MGKSADGLWHAQKVITEFDFGWINLNINENLVFDISEYFDSNHQTKS